MTRLKYKKYIKGIEISCSVLLGHEYVRVWIIPIQGVYKIKSVGNGKIIHKGNATTIKGLKTKAKKSLKLLGVNFFDEIKKK